MQLDELLKKLDYEAILYLGEENELVLTLPDRKYNQDFYHKTIWYFYDDNGLDIYFDDMEENHYVDIEDYAIKAFIYKDISERLANIKYQYNCLKNIRYDGKNIDEIYKHINSCKDKDKEEKLINVFVKLINGADYEMCLRLAKHYGVHSGFEKLISEEIIL